MDKIVIKYKPVTFDNKKLFLLKIVEQSFVCSDFAGGGKFTSRTGFQLKSCTCPSICEKSRVLFVHGSDTTSDNDIIIIEDHQILNDIIVAVKEYNQMFGPTAQTLTDEEYTIE
jgi:hypothetical protein